MVSVNCTISFLDEAGVEFQKNLELKNDQLVTLLESENVHQVIQLKGDLVFQKIWSEWLRIENVGDLKSISFSLNYAEG